MRNTGFTPCGTHRRPPPLLLLAHTVQGLHSNISQKQYTHIHARTHKHSRQAKQSTESALSNTTTLNNRGSKSKARRARRTLKALSHVASVSAAQAHETKRKQSSRECNTPPAFPSPLLPPRRLPPFPACPPSPPPAAPVWTPLSLRCSSFGRTRMAPAPAAARTTPHSSRSVYSLRMHVSNKCTTF